MLYDTDDGWWLIVDDWLLMMIVVMMKMCCVNCALCILHIGLTVHWGKYIEGSTLREVHWGRLYLCSGTDQRIFEDLRRNRGRGKDDNFRAQRGVQEEPQPAACRKRATSRKAFKEIDANGEHPRRTGLRHGVASWVQPWIHLDPCDGLLRNSLGQRVLCVRPHV